MCTFLPAKSSLAWHGIAFPQPSNRISLPGQEYWGQPMEREQKLATVTALPCSTFLTKTPQYTQHLTPRPAQLSSGSYPPIIFLAWGCIFLLKSSLFYEKLLFSYCTFCLWLHSASQGRSLTLAAWPQRTHKTLPAFPIL